MESQERYNGHYAEMKKQPIEVMQEILSDEEFAGFLMGNYIKYVMRAGHKAGETYDKDMAKANRYAEWLYIHNIDDNYVNPWIQQIIDDPNVLEELKLQLDDMIRGAIHE